MIIYSASRGKGKTAKIIEVATKYGLDIVVPEKSRARHIESRLPKDSKIKVIVAYEGQTLAGRDRGKGLAFDDLDETLRVMFRGNPVIGTVGTEFQDLVYGARKNPARTAAFYDITDGELNREVDKSEVLEQFLDGLACKPKVIDDMLKDIYKDALFERFQAPNRLNINVAGDYLGFRPMGDIPVAELKQLEDGSIITRMILEAGTYETITAKLNKMQPEDREAVLRHLSKSFTNFDEALKETYLKPEKEKPYYTTENPNLKNK